MARFALIDRNGGENKITVARLAVLTPAEPAVTEVAVVLEEQYQVRGLGTLLLLRLVPHAQS